MIFRDSVGRFAARGGDLERGGKDTLVSDIIKMVVSGLLGGVGGYGVGVKKRDGKPQSGQGEP